MLRRLARAVFGDYGLYRIYALDLSFPMAVADALNLREVTDMTDLRSAACDEIRKLADYERDDAVCCAAFDGNVPVSACWFWFGKTYEVRNFWPLQPTQAKLVQVTTAPDYRGRGLASELLTFAAATMKKRGFTHLFARIWHSNAASIAAFEKAGWRYVAFVAVLHPFGRARPWRIVLRRGPAAFSRRDA